MVNTLTAESKSPYDPNTLPPPSLGQQAIVVGGYLMMAGAVDPDTAKPYGINKAGKVDLLGAEPGVVMQLGGQAMAVVALNNFFGIEMPHRTPEGLTNLVDIQHDNGNTTKNVDLAPLTYNAQAIATSWGVDRAIDKLSEEGSPLSLSSDGKTLRQRVDEFADKHRPNGKEWSRVFTKHPIDKVLEELHSILGERPPMGEGPQIIPYEKKSKTLLHLQESGSAQCVVFSTLGVTVMEKLGIEASYAYSPGHQYVAVNGSFYDGACNKPIESPHPNTLVAEQPLAVNPSYHNNYANLLGETGRFEEAEAHHQKALRLNPKNPSYHNNYANLLGETGRFEEAEAHHQKALRLNPKNPSYHNNYAILLAIAGRIEQAREELTLAGPAVSNRDIINFVRDEIPIINSRIDRYNKGLPENEQRPHVPMPDFAEKRLKRLLRILVSNRQGE
jgi:tetratricopeptide (TPR) repeat protein